MKTKRRQELKSNDLAAWLEDVSKSASQWGGWVLGGLAVIIIVVFISRYRTNARLEARSEAFSALRTASSMQVGSMTKTPEEIRTSLATIDDLIAETPDNDFKIEALLGKADLAMSLARRALGGDETAKVDDPQAVLDDARAAYERVISKYQDRVVYHGRALYGLFQVETLGFVADQDPTHRATAEGYLTKIRDNPAFNSTPLQTAAIDMLNDLDQVFTVVEFPKRPAPTPAPSAVGDTVPLGPVQLTDPPATGGGTGQPPAITIKTEPVGDTGDSPTDDAPSEGASAEDAEGEDAVSEDPDPQ
jgi:hypothetical protein